MNITIGGIDIQVVDDDPFYEQVKDEIENTYQLDSINFTDDDVILDIGAHVGLVSMYLAKKHPGVRVYAYEPMPENFSRLVCHLRENDLLDRVEPHHLAVTADGGQRLMVRGGHHSGGATAFHDFEREAVIVNSTTIPAELEKYGIEQIRLLKLDCEGAEHEILGTAGDWLDHVSHIRGEIHQIHAKSHHGDGVERHLPAEYNAEAAAERVPDVLWTYA